MATYRVMKQHMHAYEEDFDDTSMLSVFDSLDDAREFMNAHIQDMYEEDDFANVSRTCTGTVDETIEAVDWDGNIMRLWIEVRARVVRRLFE